MQITWPIGTSQERSIALNKRVLPGNWFTSNPYLNKYDFGYHTGEDFNLDIPHWNADKGQPVYAIADGQVTFSGIGAGKTWGWLIVIQHQLDDGSAFYTRTAHTDHKNFAVPQTGDRITCGQQISIVGNADGYYINGGDHLHFDVSLTDALLTNPSHWPGLDKAGVLANYVDPIAFIKSHMSEPIPADTPATTLVQMQVSVNGGSLLIREGAGRDYPVVGYYRDKQIITIDSANGQLDPKSGLTYYPSPTDDWVAGKYLIPVVNPPVPAPIWNDPVIKYVNAPDGLILRAGDSSLSKALYVFPYRKQLTVIPTAEDYWKVVNPTGWVFSQWLQDTRPA